jgi:signal transduction histidine kinase
MITGTRKNDILLVVSDNGPGIEENDLPHIFEPFFTR